MPNGVNERKLRYALNKSGYVLHKSRARNWSLHNQLGYMIVDAYYDTCVGGSDYDFSLADVAWFVEAYCKD